MPCRPACLETPAFQSVGSNSRLLRYPATAGSHECEFAFGLVFRTLSLVFGAVCRVVLSVRCSGLVLFWFYGGKLRLKGLVFEFKRSSSSDD